MELLQENLGIKFKKARKRIKMGSEDEDSGDDEREGREELPDIDEVRHRDYLGQNIQPLHLFHLLSNISTC